MSIRDEDAWLKEQKHAERERKSQEEYWAKPENAKILKSIKADAAKSLREDEEFEKKWQEKHEREQAEKNKSFVSRVFGR